MQRRPFPWVYQYEEERRVQGGEFLRKPLLRPIVQVRLEGTELATANLAALVDSGADHVLAAPWVAQDIGVTPDPDREIKLKIGGKTREVRFADVTAHLLPPEFELFQGGFDAEAAYTWQIQVGFFTHWDAPPWNLVLGQCGFFDEFTVTLSRESRSVAVSDCQDFDRRYPQGPQEADNHTPRFKM